MSPSDVAPRSVDPESLVNYSNATIAVCTSLVTVFFILRCYVRLRYKKLWNLEDWFILISWIGTVAFMGLLAKSMAVGGGKHRQDRSGLDEIREFAYWFKIISCEYTVAICATKVAILWLYRRVFSPRNGSAFEMACFILIAANAAYYFATLVAKAFQCIPILESAAPGSCSTNLYGLLVTDGVFNTLTDLLILGMPALIIYRLQMETRKKIVVLAIFTFGLLAPIFSIVGLYMRVKYGWEDDITPQLPQIVFWSGAEITIGTICACLPELGLLTHRSETHETTTRPHSVLEGARDAVMRSRQSLHNRLSQGFGRGWSDSDTDTEGRYHWPGASSSEHTLYNKDEEDPEHVPDDAIHVHTDFHIASQVYSKRSVQNMREAYAKMHGKWLGA